MKLQKDYEELLELFNKHKVRYCVVGAYAVAFHARPRFTKDMDILVKPDLGNGKKIIDALKEFGFKSPDLSEKDFSREGKIIQIGFEPVRVDLVTSIDGCTFEEIWENRESGFYGKQKVSFIGIKELVKNKKAAGRRQDEADLEILETVRKKNNSQRSKRTK
jgi:hypothetical protein